MEKRLFRNEHDKVIAGVSSGVAEYMEVDVTIIRLLFVLSTIFLVGTGILVYVIMWIIVPVNNDPAAKFSKFNDFFNQQQNPFQASNPFRASNSFETQKKTFEPEQSWTSSTLNDAGLGNESFDAWKKTNEFKSYKKSSNETGRTVAGLFLLVIGLYFLMDEFNLIPFGFKLAKLWPLVFVAIGASFIIKSKNKNAWENWKDQQMQDSANPKHTPDQSAANVGPDPSVAKFGPDGAIEDREDGIDFTKKDI